MDYFVALLKGLLTLFLCVCVIYRFNSHSLGAKVCCDLSMYYIRHIHMSLNIITVYKPLDYITQMPNTGHIFQLKSC